MLGTLLSSISNTAKGLFQNIRLEDITRNFIPASNKIRKKKNDNIFDDVIENNDDTLNIASNEQKKIEQKQEEANIEYLLSVHAHSGSSLDCTVNSNRTGSIPRSKNKDNAVTTVSNTIINEAMSHKAVSKLILSSNSSEKHNILNDKKMSDVIKIFCDMDNKRDLSLESICFSGGGYNCVYHLGVVRYIFENPLLFKNTKYLGASGGAGIIGIILCYENNPNKFLVLDTIIQEIINMKALKLKLHKQVEKYGSILGTYVDENKFNKFIKNSDRCHISVTDITYIIPFNSIKTKFLSYKQYIDTLKASASVPFVLDDKIRTIDNRCYLDGGFSNNLPILNEETIRISCLNYPFLRAELYPHIICEFKYTFTAPNKNYILNMHDLGYGNIEEYLMKYQKRVDIYKQEKDLELCVVDIVNNPVFLLEYFSHTQSEQSSLYQPNIIDSNTTDSGTTDLESVEEHN
jgi:hypothetical protein